VALETTDVSEERITSIRVKRINKLGTILAVTLVTANVPSSLILTLMIEAISSSETSVITRAIPEDGILHRHRRETLKYYIALTGWDL
jgi:hypothetical protein